MSRSRPLATTRRALAAVAVAALTLAACGADTPDEAAPATVRIAANPWPGSYANAHVAAAILTQELGLDVRIVEIDENAQWAGLDDGTLDASLEVWPSGHADNYATFITELGTVEDGGPLGAVGQIGWFLPTSVLAEHPAMTSWEGLLGAESVFATTETGSSGQFLAADPSFVQFDEAIIANLGLDLRVVQSGSEAAQLAAVEAAIAREALPAEQRDCGYPEDVLFKAFHAGLSDRVPQAHTLLSNLRLTNDDQNAITFAMDVEGLDAAAAAKAWVDANEAVWRAWLP